MAAIADMSLLRSSELVFRVTIYYRHVAPLELVFGTRLGKASPGPREFVPAPISLPTGPNPPPTGVFELPRGKTCLRRRSNPTPMEKRSVRKRSNATPAPFPQLRRSAIGNDILHAQLRRSTDGNDFSCSQLRRRSNVTPFPIDGYDISRSQLRRSGMSIETRLTRFIPKPQRGGT